MLSPASAEPHVEASPQPGTTPMLARTRRDVFWQLAVVAWLVAPRWLQLPPWAQLLALGALLWRAVLAWRGQALPGTPWRLALLLAAVVGTGLSHHSLLSREAGVTLVALLLCLKTLEIRTRRDVQVLFFLGFFVLLTHLLDAQSLLQALALLVSVLGLLSLLILAHQPLGHPPLRHSLKLASRMALLGTPVMLLLFLLFPRLAPLWGLPSAAPGGRTGLSSHMQVGQVASLAQDETVALRVRFDAQPPPPPQALYFRGPVLTHFDGRDWRMQDAPPGAPGAPEVQALGPALAYEITLEPSAQPWLLTLDLTATAPVAPELAVQGDGAAVWRSQAAQHGLLRYQAQAYAQYALALQPPVAELQAALALPEGHNPRTLALAQQLLQGLGQTGRPADAPARLAAALAHLVQGRYRYTLEPGLSGADSADAFWFDQRQGFCEHIASAFVVLMRALGVPARVVTGYQGGERNPLDGYWVVRQSDAHAWTEVWLPGQGWRRVDPTAYVAPSRIGALRRLRPAAGDWTSTLAQVSPDLLHTLRSGWEALNNRWNQWVLSYSPQRQMDLLRQLGFASPETQDLASVLVASLGASGLGWLALSAWPRHRGDPWLRLLARARRRLVAAGFQAQAGSGPRSMAAWLASTQGAKTLPLQHWLARLDRLRYGIPFASASTAPPLASASPPGGQALASQELATLAREFPHLPWPPPHARRPS